MTSDNTRGWLPALAPGLTFLTIGLLLTDESRRPGLPGAVLCYLAGAAFVTAAAFLASSIAALKWSEDAPRARVKSNPLRRPAETPPSTFQRLYAQLTRIGTVFSRIRLSGESLAILTMLVLACIGLLTLLAGWCMLNVTPVSTQATTAGALIAGAFPALVLERHLARLPAVLWPEGVMLARMCRVPMLAMVGLGIAALLRWLGLAQLAAPIEHVVAAFTALVALELALRGLAALLLPRGPAAQQRWHTHSALANLLRLRWPDVASINAGTSQRLGIDLTRSWALAFIRRAALPFLGGLAVCAWLLTGISALGLSERAVYERLGVPVAVLAPGLHIHLPWPLGVLRPVELGRVHEIPVAFETDGGTAAATPTTPAAATIEGVAPATADRLWDASHPSEASYLVASNSGGRQNFEVINIDLQVQYRIGLSDEAARQVTYNVIAPEPIIQAAAGRMLARYFARYTVMDILGQNRAVFISGFQRELQSRLTDLSTGIEILGIVVEAIHPPPAAAAVYQGVQTAAIRSVVRVAEATAEAAQEINSAQGNATTMRNEAQAAAAERLGKARAELALFAGDREGYAKGGPAFLFERRLQHLDSALADIPFTVVDHRIQRIDAPVLDLRQPSAPLDAEP